MALQGGCFEVTELSVAARSVAACHACKNVCEVKNPENCGLVPKKGLHSLLARNDRATHRLRSVTVLWTSVHCEVGVCLGPVNKLLFILSSSIATESKHVWGKELICVVPIFFLDLIKHTETPISMES